MSKHGLVDLAIAVITFTTLIAAVVIVIAGILK